MCFGLFRQDWGKSAVPLFHVFWFYTESPQTPGLSILRIFTFEGPPVFRRLYRGEVTPAPGGACVHEKSTHQISPTDAHVLLRTIYLLCITPGVIG